MNNIIQFEQAQQISEQIAEDRQREIQDARVCITQMYLECLDATDINLLAAEADWTPNKVRREMIHDEDAEVDFLNELASFENDETDSLFDYY